MNTSTSSALPFQIKINLKKTPKTCKQHKPSNFTMHFQYVDGDVEVVRIKTSTSNLTLQSK